MVMHLQPSALTLSGRPRYRVLSIECRREKDEAFTLAIQIHPEDLTAESDISELQRFRDAMVSMVASLAVVPLTLLSKGSFTFPVGDNRYKTISLGAMKMSGAPNAVPAFGPLAMAPNLPDHIRTAYYFLWQAISTPEPLFRFLKLAVVCELLATTESTGPKSQPVVCTRCKTELPPCPQCDLTLKFSTPLSSRLEHLVPDADLRRTFNKIRNEVFHGRARLDDTALEAEVATLNTELVLAIRNYLVGKLDIPPMTVESLNARFLIAEVMMAVYYECDDPKKTPCYLDY